MITIVEYLKLNSVKGNGRTSVFFNAIFDAVFKIGITDFHETKNNERPVSFKYKGDEFKTTYEGFVYWVYNHIKYRNFSGKIF